MINSYTLDLGFCEWAIFTEDKEIVVHDEDGTSWNSSIAIFRDYTNAMLYEDYLSEVGLEADCIDFDMFEKLIKETFRIIGEQWQI